MKNLKKLVFLCLVLALCLSLGTAALAAAWAAKAAQVPVV